MNSQLIDTGVATALQGARRWAKGYAWIMAVYIALTVVSSLGVLLFSGSSISDLSNAGAGAIATFVMLLLGLALMVLPTIYLFGFVRHSEAALATGQPSAFASALTDLKSFFKFFVILVIVIAILYVLGLAAVAVMISTQGLTL